MDSDELTALYVSVSAAMETAATPARKAELHALLTAVEGMQTIADGWHRCDEMLVNFPHLDHGQSEVSAMFARVGDHIIGVLRDVHDGKEPNPEHPAELDILRELSERVVADLAGTVSSAGLEPPPDAKVTLN